MTNTNPNPIAAGNSICNGAVKELLPRKAIAGNPKTSTRGTNTNQLHACTPGLRAPRTAIGGQSINTEQRYHNRSATPPSTSEVRTVVPQSVVHISTAGTVQVQAVLKLVWRIPALLRERIGKTAANPHVPRISRIVSNALSQS